MRTVLQYQVTSGQSLEVLDGDVASTLHPGTGSAWVVVVTEVGETKRQTLKLTHGLTSAPDGAELAAVAYAGDPMTGYMPMPLVLWRFPPA